MIHFDYLIDKLFITMKFCWKITCHNIYKPRSIWKPIYKFNTQCFQIKVKLWPSLVIITYRLSKLKFKSRHNKVYQLRVHNSSLNVLDIPAGSQTWPRSTSIVIKLEDDWIIIVRVQEPTTLVDKPAHSRHLLNILFRIKNIFLLYLVCRHIYTPTLRGTSFAGRQTTRMECSLEHVFCM